MLKARVGLLAGDPDYWVLEVLTDDLKVREVLDRIYMYLEKKGVSVRYLHDWETDMYGFQIRLERKKGES